MRFKSNFFLFAILFMSAQITYSSGGTMVGNGGGFAEMQAIYLDQNLSQYLDKTTEYDGLNFFLKQNKDQSFKFIQSCPTVDPDYIIANPLEIPSCLLYTTRSTALGLAPRPLSEIGAVIFAFRWLAHSHADNWKTSFEKGMKLFTEVQINQKKLPLTWRSKREASIIQWQIEDGKNSLQSQQLTLELADFSIDLLPLLKESLSCNGRMSFEIRYASLKIMNPNYLHAAGPISWLCEDKKFKGVLNLKVREQTNFDYEDINLEVYITQKKLDQY